MFQSYRTHSYGLRPAFKRVISYVVLFQCVVELSMLCIVMHTVHSELESPFTVSWKEGSNHTKNLTEVSQAIVVYSFLSTPRGSWGRG